MTTMTMKRYALILAALLPIGFVGITYPRFRKAMRCGRERLLTRSHTVATEYGDIEYAIQGSGLPVLLLHGAGGGYDQGLLIGEFFLANAGELHVQVSLPEAAEVRGGS